MKTPVALVLSLASFVLAQAQTVVPAPTQPGPTPKAVPATKTVPGTSKAPVAGKTAPAAKAAPAGKDTAKKKDEPPAKIEGVTIPRGNKFLGLQIVNGTFKLSFYDEKKKPVAADVARAVLRWDPKYKVGKERVVLNPGEDGKSLTSARSIRPPYTFKLFITLVKDAGESEEPVGESFTIDFSA